ncbi:Nucleoside triphosphate pyrophosphohydrolase, partial [Haemophilus influenzae]
RNLYFR